MDLDNLQQNMNTRVVFKEPRGMIRWLQLFFAIIAFSTVVDFHTTVTVQITCPTTAVTSSTTTTTTTTTVAPPPANASQPQPSPAPAPAPAPQAQPASSSTVAPQPLGQAQIVQPQLVINYPFDFAQQQISNTCPGQNYTYTHVSSLNGSPQFFVMTGVLSLIYASLTIVIYLLFSSTYESIPVWPVADLICTGILCLFWFIGSSSFSSGVSLLKTTVVYENLQQAICPNAFTQIGGQCLLLAGPSWKSLNVGLVSGFTSFFLWGAGMWFVYKETHFHTPRDVYGTR